MRASLISVLLLGTVACNQSDFGDPRVADPDPPPGPGSDEWGDENLACDSADDCGAGEVCAANICQPARCDDGPYDSAAPLGPRQIFFADKEILVADATAVAGTHYADLYLPSGSGVAYAPAGGSYDTGGASVDIAAGNLTGEQRHSFVAATERSTRLQVVGANGSRTTIDAGFVPVAVAAGDVDGDGLDEAIALASDGRIALCDVDRSSCTGYRLDAAGTGIGLEAADIDGDGLAEPLFLFANGNKTSLLAWNTDAEEGEAAIVGASFSTRFKTIAAGDLDGDHIAEVALLEDGGWLGLASDRLHLYDLSRGAVTGIVAASAYRSSIDLAIDDLDGDDLDEVVVVGARDVQVLEWTGSGLRQRYSGSLGATASPRRIALIDSDGDSATGRLVGGPELIPGPTRPTFVVTFPPYDADNADGDARVSVGRRTDVTESLSDTVALSLGVSVGVEGDFLGLFKAKLLGKVERTLTRRRTRTTVKRVGDRFSLEPQPELYGWDYGAVVMSCGCFHQYTYELVDPGGRVGGDGSRFALMVPVGGNTTVWSTARYNALAARIDDLPTIEVHGAIGDPSAYPSRAMTLEGAQIPPGDLVFRDVSSFRVSDVGEVGFSLAVGEYETNEQAMNTEVRVSLSASAGLTFGTDVSAAFGRGYSVTIGELASFSGAVPPIPDDPATPEDEYGLHAYSFTPVVYRQSYATGDGGGGYYVLTYAVGAN